MELSGSGDLMSTRERRAFARELFLVARRWRSALDDRLKDLGLNHLRWAVLERLRETPNGVSQTTLAADAGVEPSTLVRMIDAMASDGLVERRPSRKDRRINLIHITPSAVRLLDQVEQLEAGLRRSLLDDFRDEEIAALHEVLYRLRILLEAR